jgi:RNA polymerase sigma factor (sigma-70 family)
MQVAVQNVVRQVRALVVRPMDAACSDRQLLAAFAEQGDEAAFAALLRRHGPLVLGVCRRILGNLQDAEDAFQATFLVLARKAGRLAWRDSVKNWLYGVACRVAMKARSQGLRRRQKEQAARQQAAAVSPAEAGWEELRSVLDEELERLPAEYRAPLLLCYLEGRTRDEAAEELGWSPGSVKGRLERGRELLRQRLARRGLTLSAALCVGLLGEPAGAGVPAALAAATARAAAQFAAGSLAGAGVAPGIIHLAQGVLQTMLIAKIKSTGYVLLLVGVLVTGGGWGVHQTWAQQERQPERPGARREGQPDAAQERRPGGDRPRDPEQARDGRRGDEIQGLLKAIDVKVGTITIESVSRDRNTTEKSYNLAAKDIKVSTTVGQAVTLTDLSAGLHVHLQLKEATDVTAIRVDAPSLTGFVAQVDAAKKTITIATGGREATVNTTLDVADNARMAINGRAGKLDDVQLRQPVQVMLSLDKKTVLALQSGNPRENARAAAGREENPRRDPRTLGVVVDIDPAKQTLSLLIGRGDEQEIRTFSVAKEMKVKVYFEDRRPVQEIALAELGKAVNAKLLLGEDGKTVTAIDVNAPVLRGRITGFDVKRTKLTVTSDGGQEQTLNMEGATVRVNGQESSLDELPGRLSVVLILSMDRQRVLGILAQPAAERRPR